MTVGRNAEIQNNFAWDLSGSGAVGNAPGTINLNGGTGTATISGAAWRLSPDGSDAALNANNGTGVIESDFTMLNGTATIATVATLQFDGTVMASGGTIENSGTMIFNADTTIGSGVDFNMIGTASLVINATVNIDTPDFELDSIGPANGVTTINAGGVLDLDLGAGADYKFEHTINMNGGELDVTTLDNDWSLGFSATSISGGEINAAGGATSTINGETFIIYSDINVSANSRLNINAVSNYFSSANVVIDAGSTLVHDTVTYDGGSYTGGGVLRKGNATIAGNTTWDVAIVDIDGTSGNDSTAINNGATLTINTDSIDNSGDGIDATVTIADTGVLAFNLSGGESVVFDPAGRLDYNGNSSVNIFLTGSDVTMNGTMNITGDGRTTARLDIGGTINITGNGPGQGLRLSGGTIGVPNQLLGGTINGNAEGLLRSNANRALEGFGTINADVEFVDTARLLANGGTLNINGAILDVGVIGTADDDGILNVLNAWNTNVANRVDLNGGQLRGGTITNDGAAGISGDGLVTPLVINNTRIDAQNGGTLRLIKSDWDGSTSTGVLNALDGNLEIVDTFFFGFDGTVNVGNTRELFVNGFNLGFHPGSTLALTGGTLRSENSQTIQGAVTINTNPSTIETPMTEFRTTATVTLNDDLSLDGDSTVEAGATFAGGGALINLTGSTLNLQDGADVDVLVVNQGTLDLGASPGQTTGLDFEQTATGNWTLEIMETGLNDYDRMTLTGTAQLDGELDVTLIGGFNPALNDTFTILSTAAGINGVFSLFDFSAATLDPGLMWDVIYNATNVQLEVVALPSFTADFDNDGDVDGDDLAQWEGDFGGPGSDADADGDSDGADFLTWQRQFGSGVSLASNTSAVPEPSTLLLASLVACFGLLVPRQRK